MDQLRRRSRWKEILFNGGCSQFLWNGFEHLCFFWKKIRAEIPTKRAEIPTKRAEIPKMRFSWFLKSNFECLMFQDYRVSQRCHCIQLFFGNLHMSDCDWCLSVTGSTQGNFGWRALLGSRHEFLEPSELYWNFESWTWAAGFHVGWCCHSGRSFARGNDGGTSAAPGPFPFNSWWVIFGIHIITSKSSMAQCQHPLSKDILRLFKTSSVPAVNPSQWIFDPRPCLTGIGESHESFFESRRQWMILGF